jgi:hypothetical protein
MLIIKGKYMWADGSKFDGEWLNNKITGKVIIFLKK